MGTYEDTSWADLRQLTRLRRAERRAATFADPTLRFSVLELGPERRARLEARAWRDRQWRLGRRCCGYCGRRMTLTPNRPHQVTIDHREPLSRGGADDPTNWLLACWLCNHLKGDMPEAAFRLLLAAGRFGYLIAA